MNKIILWIISFLLLWVSVVTTWSLVRDMVKQDEEKPVPVTTIMDENSLIKAYIKQGKESKVHDFYDKLIGDRTLTYLIISNALSYDIPVNYFVSLGYTESRFNPSAVGKNLNTDGSIRSYDYGVFQLNSNTYSAYEKSYLMDVENNVRIAATHLVTQYRKYGNWFEALLSYNAGGTEVIKNTTVKHFISVLSMNSSLNESFIKMEF